ncbi:nucleoside-diphosphate sugar epimerase [Luteibacter yeojuensis]|uniref:Nucleoside-diphosphate sugar epimerase n=1 Tax=Luteibacter yeojuensis TaxID=345309 RepID=A0A7X5QYC8_9GAMM|nr:mitochondrial fission ELM1 family protein [Luteibacter yeojuensis]NID17547.1 nucleoside-diphosphate sugar epimerase [Luteibacter yeojuensis]
MPREACWVLTDGAAGNRRQALALAEALTPSIREIVVSLRPPWSWFAPRTIPGARLALGRQEENLLPPWPALAIGCGRQAAWATRQIRRWSAGACLAVQILDPRIDPSHWDLVVAPKHDGLHGDNVLNPLGSLNPIDDGWLADGRDAFAPFAALPGPRLGVLVGGARRGTPFDAAASDAFLAAVRARHAVDGGSVLVAASRRTPDSILPRIREAFAGLPGVVWTGSADGPNPYPGILGWADRLIVTPDSVNMLSEACATGRPVHTFAPVPLRGKLGRFHAELRAAGLLHDIDAITLEAQLPLRETDSIAVEVRKHLGLL